MKKIDNFKIYFSSVLEEKLNLNKEQINQYLVLKQKQENFDNKKLIGCIIGYKSPINLINLSKNISIIITTKIIIF